MAEPFSVRVVGLNRLRRGLRAMSPELRRGLDRELKAVASPIAADAKRRYRKLHPRRRGGKGSQRGIRAQRRRRQGPRNYWFARYPYLLGQEWGSHGQLSSVPARQSRGSFLLAGDPSRLRRSTRKR